MLDLIIDRSDHVPRLRSENETCKMVEIKKALVSFEAKVMGVMFYPAVGALCSKKLIPVQLVRERDNIHDINSVLIITKQVH